jgi:hypothetical protein
MMKKSISKFVLPALQLLSLLLVLASCQGQAPIEENQEAAQESFKKAIKQIDAGNTAAAEENLKLSISQNPTGSSRARAILASLYAEKANVRLKDWLDPFYTASVDIDSKTRLYKNSEFILSQLSEEFEKIERGNKALLTEEEAELRKRVHVFVRDMGRLSLGLMVTLDVFQQLPMLDEAQLIELDRAIKVLVPSDSNFRLTEEARMYLAVLSVIRLVNNLKRHLGGTEFIEYLRDKEAICNSSPESIEALAKEVRLSIFYLYKGLEVFPDEESNNRRDARKKVTKFIDETMSGKFWDDLDRFFMPGTIEERVGMKTFTDICHMVGNGKKEESKVNLFNPEED